jgi:hemoglobin
MSFKGIAFKSKISSLLLAVAAVGAMSVSSVASAEDSLFNRLGGTYNIAQTVDHLVDKIYVNRGLNANPKLKAVHDRPETKAGFKVMLTNWVIQETGGPKVYQTDEFGRGKSMKDSHPHLAITNREFNIILVECLETFYAYNIPDHEISQLMADLESYRKVIVTGEKPVSEPTRK